MIIQFVLVALLVSLVLLVFSQRAFVRVAKLFLGCAFGAGVVLVLHPELANRIAWMFGVGRGADLLLYFAISGGSFLFVRLYVKTRQLELRQTELVRQLALQRWELERTQSR
jgi:hypothetical protein